MELEAQRSLVRVVKGGSVHVRSTWHGECRCSELEMVQRQMKNRFAVYSNEEKSQGIKPLWLMVQRSGRSCCHWGQGLTTHGQGGLGWRAAAMASWGHSFPLVSHSWVLELPEWGVHEHPCCPGDCPRCVAGHSPAVWGWPGSLQSSIQHQDVQIHLLRSKWEQCVNDGAAGTWECLAEYLWLHLISEALMDAVCAQGMAAWEDFNSLLTVMFWLSLVLKITYVNMKLLLIFLLKLYYAQRFNERKHKSYEIIRQCLLAGSWFRLVIFAWRGLGEWVGTWQRDFKAELFFRL